MLTNALLDTHHGVTRYDRATLVIAYKELRRLEHAILQRQSELVSNDALFNESRINIENFYGIEIDDFAIEVATLSVWIAKHQMNRELQEQFGISIPVSYTHLRAHET